MNTKDLALPEILAGLANQEFTPGDLIRDPLSGTFEILENGQVKLTLATGETQIYQREP
jgi:hypothetical protein